MARQNVTTYVSTRLASKTEVALALMLVRFQQVLQCDVRIFIRAAGIFQRPAPGPNSSHGAPINSLIRTNLWKMMPVAIVDELANRAVTFKWRQQGDALIRRDNLPTD